MKKHLLFICTANLCRSPLAASLFDNSDIYEAKSAGTDVKPEYINSVQINQDLINWADEIFVMSEKEDHHLSYIKENLDISNKKVTVLDISNVYNTSVSEERDLLIKILKDKLSLYLNNS